MGARAKLRDNVKRRDVNGSHQVRSDFYWWTLTVIDMELTDCVISFTAKSDLADPDAAAEIKLDSNSFNPDTTGGIRIDTNDGNVLVATVVVPPSATASLDFDDEQRVIKNQAGGITRLMYPLYFDVQVGRKSPVVSAPKIQTFFREQGSFFYVLQDVTNRTA